jgi:hypothetical protein
MYFSENDRKGICHKACHAVTLHFCGTTVHMASRFQKARWHECACVICTCVPFLLSPSSCTMKQVAACRRGRFEPAIRCQSRNKEVTQSEKRACFVFCNKKERFFAPDAAFPIAFPEHLALNICLPVDIDHQGANQDRAKCQSSGQVVRVVGQVQCLRCVNSRHPVEAPPAEVVASTIMCNVHRSPVSSLPQEELEVIQACRAQALVLVNGGMSWHQSIHNICQ